MSVDMGAPAIDKWKSELPGQYFEMGISEQNAINVAAGLSRGGKKVFVYFMAVWVHRCFEQIRYSCSIASNKITILGNGVGLGYAPAGPAHEPNEDIAVMKSLHNIEIYSPSSRVQIPQLVDLCLSNKSLNYVRLERKSSENIEQKYSHLLNQDFTSLIYQVEEGMYPVTVVISYGYLTSRVHDAIQNLSTEKAKRVLSLDLQKIWPLDLKKVNQILINAKLVLFLEEQSINGSLYEYFCRYISESGLKIMVKSIHLPNQYIFENGNQDQLLDSVGLSVDSITNLLDS